MSIKVADQTLSTSVASAISVLHNEANLPEFEGSETTSDFIKKTRIPFAKGTKQPVTKEYLQLWGALCDVQDRYIFELKDKEGRYLQSGRHKTTIWGFIFSIHSIKTIKEELLGHSYEPYKFALT